jgi:archaellum component FlaC
MSESAGWENYSKLILQQLEGLSKGIDGLREELQQMKQEITALKAREDKVQEIHSWKQRIDEVVSPPQLDKAIKEIEELRLFKTKAVTIFAVVQFIMAAVVAASKVF